RAPLVFSERRPGNQFRPSTAYVPGAVIRGALAQQFLDAGREGDEEFRALFTGSDAPLFRNAYPALFSHNAGVAAFAASRPLPATAYSCKTEPGLRKVRGRVRGHGVFDGLIDRLCCESLGVKVPYLPRCNHEEHDGGGERVEAYGGRFYAAAPEGLLEVSVGSRLSTRVAVNRRRKVAEEQMLYSPLVLDETTFDDNGVERVFGETTFHGNVVLREDDRPLVERRLPELTHVGSGVARGFGHVSVNVEEVGADDPGGRVEKFNGLLGERWESWEPLGGEGTPEPPRRPGAGTFFSVTLMSDAILREGGWSPTVRLEPEMLGDAGRNATLLRCYASGDYRGGWNTAWRLPKDTELVARMGSAYVYHTTDDAGDAGWLASLRTLEERGVGDRRREGFGEVRVCDDFHARIQEVQR
ncbi:MAG TPA: CRISPR-associated RAMP protein Csx10, partial [Pyrinomonadaceae bacterium]|nr:CRISPR-associated RAMP protein Csx10 [Pyrinomonadaceae bacterium]